MQKRVMMTLVAGWFTVTVGGEGLLRAADPALPLAQPSGSGVGQASAPGMGLTSIFVPSGKTGVLFLAEGSRFQASGRGMSPLYRYSVRGVRPVLRDYFYHNLRLGVTVLDQTLIEFAQRKGQALRLSRAEQQELSGIVNGALYPILHSYHSAAPGRGLFDISLSLEKAREQAYEQIFRYLSQRTADLTIREFMRRYFEPSGNPAGAFRPHADVRTEFLALWTKNFAQQPPDATFPAHLPGENWEGALVAYHREIRDLPEDLGPYASETVKHGLETVLSLLVGWAPVEQHVAPADRVALQKIAALPFRDGEAHQRFVQDLMVVAGSEPHSAGERGRNLSARGVLWGMPRALATFRQRSDFLQMGAALDGNNPAVTAPEARRDRGPLLASTALQELFGVGSPVANLGTHLDTNTFVGLMGAQTLRRLEHSTAVLEATLAALGVRPHLPMERVGRLTELLCRGYQQYPAAATTEQKMLNHLRLVEEAYWKEIGQCYPEAVRLGKFTDGFVPTAAATQDFLQAFATQAKEKSIPGLSWQETHLLEQTLPTLQTKEGVAEVVHLLLARGAGYAPASLPALEEVQRQMREYELHPTWVSKRSRAMAHVIRELAEGYRLHSGAPQWEPVKRLLQPLLTVGFGLDAPSSTSAAQPREVGKVELPVGTEGRAREEASTSGQHEAEGGTSTEGASASRSAEPAMHHAEAPR